MKIIAVIPARGGSKGIPRKNLRPLCGRPLLSYSIEAAKNSRHVDVVLVTTEDEEVALFARRFGAKVIMRPAQLAGDDVTVDPVIIHAVRQFEKDCGHGLELIFTIQPTSPLIAPSDIDEAVSMLRSGNADTIISVTDDRHLRWTVIDGKATPLYKERLNRQSMPPTMRETGAIIACRREVLENGTRIGDKISLLEIPSERSIDIDCVTDFYICKGLMRRRNIAFNVIGRPEVGMGHAYRALTLAHELVGHNVRFICSQSDRMALEYLASHNYECLAVKNEEILTQLLKWAPDLVINDALEVPADMVAKLRQAGVKCVNFEDMGPGAEVANLVVNALYPHQLPQEHILVGPKYFCLRDEFMHLGDQSDKAHEFCVLMAFGGVDEGNLTARVLEAVGAEVVKTGASIEIVLGPGYAKPIALESLASRIGGDHIKVIRSTPRISDFMAHSGMAITSGGRTVLELAALGVPTVVICQNDRETTHSFANSENGILNLGHRKCITDEAIHNAVLKVLHDSNLRATMKRKALQLDLRGGKKRTVDAILALLN